MTTDPVIVSHRSGLSQAFANVDRRLPSISPREWLVLRFSDDIYTLREKTWLYRYVSETSNTVEPLPLSECVTGENPREEVFIARSIYEVIKYLFPEKCFTEEFEFPKVCLQVMGDVISDFMLNCRWTQNIVNSDEWSDGEQQLWDILSSRRERCLNAIHK